MYGLPVAFENDIKEKFSCKEWKHINIIKFLYYNQAFYYNDANHNQ